jgi:hypothetical protein
MRSLIPARCWRARRILVSVGVLSNVGDRLNDTLERLDLPPADAGRIGSKGHRHVHAHPQT